MGILPRQPLYREDHRGAEFEDEMDKRQQAETVEIISSLMRPYLVGDEMDRRKKGCVRKRVAMSRRVLARDRPRPFGA